MVTHAQCQERAEQYIARAERDPRLKTNLINAAQAWLLLGLQMKQLEMAADNDSFDTRSIAVWEIACAFFTWLRKFA